jgi:hypothetical protein
MGVSGLDGMQLLNRVLDMNIFLLALNGAQNKYMQHGSFTSLNLLTISGILCLEYIIFLK